MEKLFNFVLRKEVIGFYLKAANETFLEVFRDGAAAPGAERRTLHHFCLQTDVLADLRQRLVDRGYAPREIIMGADQSPQFWVQDPNGLEIEFQEYTDKSSQLTGHDVELTE